MPRPIAFDLVRGVLASHQRTPRGIDRIETGYLDTLVRDWPADVVGVIPTPWGIRWFPRERLAQGLEFSKRTWGETGTAEGDPGLARLKAALAGDDTGAARPTSVLHRTKGRLRGTGRFFRTIVGDRWSFGRPISTLPKDAIYLNVGHYGLAAPWLLGWLDSRPDVEATIMIHDVIPLERPDLVAPSTVASHRAVIRSTVRYARRLIVPTEAAAESLRLELGDKAAGVPIHAIHLPIDDVFRAPITPEPELAAHPYFLILGAVEPRKNHLLLLNIWPELVRRFPERPPSLVIAGSAGFMSDQVLYMIQRSAFFRRHVKFASGLSSPALASLMAHARAVVMPSFAEGFGLPPVEALTLGTPAVLSDIAAHREAAGTRGIFIDPTDGPGWLAALGDLMDDGIQAETRRRIAGFDPADWPRYMRAVETILGAG